LEARHMARNRPDPTNAGGKVAHTACRLHAIRFRQQYP
jgi:hypothetical protein